MARKYDKSIKPTERDLQALAFMGTTGGVTAKQLFEQVFKGQCSERTMKARLKQLKDGGFLDYFVTDARSHIKGASKHENVYYIMRKGRMLFDTQVRQTLAKGKPPAESNIAHTLILSDAFVTLSLHHTIYKLTREEHLRGIEVSKRRRNAGYKQIETGDAEMYVTPCDTQGTLSGTYRVEIDAAHYHGQKLMQKLHGLQAMSQPVLYFCPNQERYTQLAPKVANFSNITLMVSTAYE